MAQCLFFKTDNMSFKFYPPRRAGRQLKFIHREKASGCYRQIGSGQEKSHRGKHHYYRSGAPDCCFDKAVKSSLVLTHIHGFMAV